MKMICDNKRNLLFYLKGNPWKGVISDDQVMRYWDLFGTRSSMKAAAAGLPDFFVYKICEGFLYQNHLELQFVEGNGNCLPNSILRQLNFDDDPGADLMYTHTYLRRSVVMHLLENWEVLGNDIKENITLSYGRPDSEIGGMKIKKVTGKGKNRKEEYGFSIHDWCTYILRAGSWCDEIFVKLVSSMWGCRIAVIRSDCLRAVTYRYEGSYDEADIILLFNSNPVKGHYSPVVCSGKDLSVFTNNVEKLCFSPNYKKDVDLNERLDRRDYIWDLDDQKAMKRLFTKKRGYVITQEEIEKEKREDGKVIGTGVVIGKDEILLKKQEYDELVKKSEGFAQHIKDDTLVVKKTKIIEFEKQIKELKKAAASSIGNDEVVMKKETVDGYKKRIKELEKGVGIGDDQILVNEEEFNAMKAVVDDLNKGGKNVVYLNKEMERIISLDSYSEMKNRCLELEEKVKNLEGGEERVIVDEAQIKILESEVEHVRKNLSLLAEGKDVEEVTERRTPRKRRASQGDQPPRKEIARMVARKTADIDKEMPDELEHYEKTDTFCKVCKEELHTHENLVRHNKRIHENESNYSCRECGKTFLTSQGHREHVNGHVSAKRIACVDPKCPKTFVSKLALKAHIGLKHSKNPRPRVPCKFANEEGKGCPKTFAAKGNMIEHLFKCKFNPDGMKEYKCDICFTGGFFMQKRLLEHKRKVHGWE